MFCAYVYDFIVIFILTKTHYSHLCAKKGHTNVTMHAFIYSFIHSFIKSLIFNYDSRF